MGDLDLDGFKDLNDLCIAGFSVKSVLMGTETLDRYSEFVVTGNTRVVVAPNLMSELTREERACADKCWETGVRLEQERVRIDEINDALMLI